LSVRSHHTKQLGRTTQVAVFPPAVFVPIVQELVHGTQVKVGVQDVHYEAKGAFTGSVSAGQAAALGVEYVLVGHSERRSLFGDTDEAVRAKVRAILDHAMKPILCIGETKEEYEGGLVQVGGVALVPSLVGLSLDFSVACLLRLWPLRFTSALLHTVLEVERVQGHCTGALSLWRPSNFTRWGEAERPTHSSVEPSLHPARLNVARFVRVPTRL
jgi:hypothetical protein